MLILAVVAVPRMGLEPAEDVAPAEEKAAAKGGLGMRFWAMLISTLLLNMVNGIVNVYFLSFYVAEFSLGTAATVGSVMSIATFVAFLFCLLFGPIRKFLRSWTSLVFLGMGLLAVILLVTMHSTAVLIVSSCLLCCASASQFAYFFAESAAVVAPEKIGWAYSLFSAVTTFAALFYTYIGTGLMGAFGTGGAFAPTLVFYAGMIAVAVVIEIVTIPIQKKASAAE